MNATIVDYYGKQRSRCGYCKGSIGSVSYGMHAYVMTPQDYQDLIDRGWRRCGHYCYKQDNETTCCPCYTIKCNALEFKLRKSHKKILKRMNHFLREGKKEKASHKPDGNGDEEVIEDKAEYQIQVPDLPIKHINVETAELSGMKKNEQINQKSRELRQQQHLSATNKPNQKSNVFEKDGKDDTDMHRLCKKPKQKHFEYKVASKKLPQSSNADKSVKNKEKTLRDFINNVTPDNKHKLKLITVQVDNNEFMKTINESFELYKKYQTIIHNDSPKNIKDYVTFLQKSPIKYTKSTTNPEVSYGSFHQQYWLDDKLIAVAVLDTLPHCVSSVYFFYDPDYSFLSLGTYSSLREIAFVQELAETIPTLTNYYMGFYIHSCPKMRYKGQLMPSYLLCPETYTWHLITDELRLNLDSKKYMRLNGDMNVRDLAELSSNNINNLILLIDQSTFIKYGDFIKVYGKDDNDDMLILEFGKLVGNALVERIVYVKI